MAYQIWNRRYTGSKYKLAEWISNLITENCSGKSFCDIFNFGSKILIAEIVNTTFDGIKTIIIGDVNNG